MTAKKTELKSSLYPVLSDSQGDVSYFEILCRNVSSKHNIKETSKLAADTQKWLAVVNRKALQVGRDTRKFRGVKETKMAGLVYSDGAQHVLVVHLAFGDLIRIKAKIVSGYILGVGQLPLSCSDEKDLERSQTLLLGLRVNCRFMCCLFFIVFRCSLSFFQSLFNSISVLIE